MGRGLGSDSCNDDNSSSADRGRLLGKFEQVFPSFNRLGDGVLFACLFRFHSTACKIMTNYCGQRKRKQVQARQRQSTNWASERLVRVCGFLARNRFVTFQTDEEFPLYGFKHLSYGIFVGPNESTFQEHVNKT